MARLINYLPGGITKNLSSHARAFLSMRRIGQYQAKLLRNEAAWDGRDLGGKAALYASKYRRAAMRLFSDLRLALRGSQYYPAIVPGRYGPSLEIATVKRATKLKRQSGKVVRGYNKPYAIVTNSNEHLRPLFLKAMGVYSERKSDRVKLARFGKLRLVLASSRI